MSKTLESRRPQATAPWLGRTAASASAKGARAGYILGAKVFVESSVVTHLVPPIRAANNGT